MDEQKTWHPVTSGVTMVRVPVERWAGRTGCAGGQVGGSAGPEGLPTGVGAPRKFVRLVATQGEWAAGQRPAAGAQSLLCTGCATLPPHRPNSLLRQAAGRRMLLCSRPPLPASLPGTALWRTLPSGCLRSTAAGDTGDLEGTAEDGWNSGSCCLVPTVASGRPLPARNSWFKTVFSGAALLICCA